MASMKPDTARLRKWSGFSYIKYHYPVHLLVEMIMVHRRKLEQIDILL